jgi:TatD DNase family protein
VLSSPSIADRVLSVHARGAEAETIAALTDAGVTAILHWYSGALKHAERALEAGLYFSGRPRLRRTRQRHPERRISE